VEVDPEVAVPAPVVEAEDEDGVLLFGDIAGPRGAAKTKGSILNKDWNDCMETATTV
jgi:hypothetical protein